MITGRRLSGALMRALVLVALWWILVEGSRGTPLLAAAVILVALITSYALAPETGPWLRAGGVMRFIPFFLAQSMRGGLDVARRAFDPRLPIQPGTVEYTPTLHGRRTRALFAGVVSLLPGTLAVDLPREGPVRIHVLRMDSFRSEDLAELDRRIDAIFRR